MSGNTGITYKIGGKYNPKAEKDALKGIKNLTSAAKTFNLAVAGFVGAKIFQGLHAAINGSTEAFQTQNSAENKLYKSVKNNANLSIDAFSKLKQAAAGLQGKSVFGDEQLMPYQAKLANMKLTQQQINDTMQAAVDLASSGDMTLQQAMDSLAGTFSGTAGQLRKISPEVAELTTEELKNGDAVKIIAEQYKGFGEAMTNTFAGRDTQFNNVFGDLKEQLGGVSAALKFITEGRLLKPIQDLTDYIGQHQTQIINFALNLPEIFSIAFSTIKEIFVRTFSNSSTFRIVFTSIGSILLQVTKTVFETIYNFLGAVSVTIFDPILTAYNNFCVLINNGIVSIVNFALNKVQDLVNTLLQNKVIKFLIEKFTGDKVQTVKFQLLQKADYKSWSSTGKEIADAWKTTGANFVENIKNIKDTAVTAGENIGDQYKDILSKNSDKINKILNKDLPGNLKNAMHPENAAGNASGETEVSGFSKLFAGLKSNFSGILGTLGQLGTAIKAVMSSNWIGLIIQLITSFFSAASQIESVSKVMNLFSTIAENAVSVLKPLLSSIFAPFAAMLKDIGHILGYILKPAFEQIYSLLQPAITILRPLFAILSPIFKGISYITTALLKMNPTMSITAKLAEFGAKTILFIYNKIFVPVINGIITVMNILKNIWIGTYNAIYLILSKIKLPKIDFSWGSWHHIKYPKVSISWDNLADDLSMSKQQMTDLNSGHIDTVSDSDLDTDTTASGSGSTTNSNSASYTAAKDVTCNIYFQNSAVCGDLRELALLIAKELKSAGALGYDAA